MPDKRPTVLVVDDSTTSRRFCSDHLRRVGFDVLEAATATEAAEHIQNGPDLIVLDVDLPDGNGLDVCRKLRAGPATALIPIVLVGVRA